MGHCDDDGVHPAVGLVQEAPPPPPPKVKAPKKPTLEVLSMRLVHPQIGEACRGVCGAKQLQSYVFTSPLTTDAMHAPVDPF